MEFTGKIKEINHIVISDPDYDKNVWCRYEKENLKEKNWSVYLDVYSVEEQIGDLFEKGTEFIMLLQKYKKDCKITDEGNLRSLSNIETKEYKIGMDSACVALGINDKADYIINSKNEWQPDCAINTGTDGVFGNVVEGTKDGSLRFLLITGYVNEVYMNCNNLFDYLKNQFDIKELVKEDLTVFGDFRELAKGTKVEVYTCNIKNDVGGTTSIRNSDYKSNTDGDVLIIHNPDGSVEESRLTNNDKLIDMPIEIEILDSHYDYETGYRYKGKVIDSNLIEEIKKIGTTRHTLEDAKRVKENYDPTIVSFSEFDIVKILSKEDDITLGV